MRFVTFDASEGQRPGILRPAGPSGGAGDDEVVDLGALAADATAVLDAEPGAIEAAVATAPRWRRDAVRLLAPLRPASLRDFLAFEDHARAGAARRGEGLAAAWYDRPVYYKGNHREILGPEESVSWPPFTERLDFELEIACVIGRRGRALTAAEAEEVIAGYTIMNDWSARDLQRAEMATRLGPARSKDFATSLGPVLVTADEIDPRDGLRMVARVNGEVWCEASSAGMHWSFPQMIASVSEAETVHPGDVYGSGTPLGGCGLDLDRWIRPGDVIELEVEGIGILRSPVIRP